MSNPPQPPQGPNSGNDPERERLLNQPTMPASPDGTPRGSGSQPPTPPNSTPGGTTYGPAYGQQFGQQPPGQQPGQIGQAQGQPGQYGQQQPGQQPGQFGQAQGQPGQFGQQPGQYGQQGQPQYGQPAPNQPGQPGAFGQAQQYGQAYGQQAVGYAQQGFGNDPGNGGKGGNGRMIALVAAFVILLGGIIGGTAWFLNRDGDAEAQDPGTTVSPSESTSPSVTGSLPPPTFTTPTPTTPTTPAAPSSPAAPTSPAKPTSPATPSSPSTPTGAPVTKADFDENWNFQLDNVKFNAKYVDGWDYDTCAPIDAQGKLAKWGCRSATEMTYTAFGGRAKLTNLFLRFDNDIKAETISDNRIKVNQVFKLQDESYFPDYTLGRWRDGSASEYVVVSFVTSNGGVRADKAGDILSYFHSDFKGALLFR